MHAGKLNIREMAHWLYRDGANCVRHLEASEMLENYVRLKAALQKELRENPEFYLPEEVRYLLKKD